MRYGSDGKPEGSFKNKPAPGGNPQRRPVPVRAIPTPHEGLHRCLYLMEFGRMFNRFRTSTSGHAGEFLRGAAPCRRGGQDPTVCRSKVHSAVGGKSVRGAVPVSGVRIHRPGALAHSRWSDIATARLKGCTQGCRSSALKRAVGFLRPAQAELRVALHSK